jgi:hypothetical protein
MNVSDPQTVFIGTFADPALAGRFVGQLRRAGFADEQVGVLTPDGGGESGRVAETALAGALAGGTTGILAGLALASGLIPGIGPVLAGGLLAGALGGAAVGASAGGLLAALLALGLSEEQAHHYAGQVQAGRTLVAVQAPGRLAEAAAIYRRCEEDAARKAPPHDLEVVELDELRGNGP